MKLLQAKGKRWTRIDDLINPIHEEYEVPAGFCKMMLRLFVRHEVAEEKGQKLHEMYRAIVFDYEEGWKLVSETFDKEDQVEAKDISDYYKDYGFESLVDDVAKWIDHEGRTVKEYDTDRLLIGRYIDFLEKARQWSKWFKKDQAVARKRLKKIRDAQKAGKNG